MLTAGRQRGGWRWRRVGGIAVGSGGGWAERRRGALVVDGSGGELQFGEDGEDRLTLDTRCYERGGYFR